MPRWKALPPDLDPQIREFTGQLRRLVDRSGLSLAAVADRTGYSKTSWERYLNGRLLAPRGAIYALAEVTGTNRVHLNTMWELSERAWSRAEMRQDMTMESIRITQARAALGESGQNPPGHGRSRSTGGVGTAPGRGTPGHGRRPAPVPPRGGTVPHPRQPRSGPDVPPGGQGLPPAVAYAAGLGGPPPPEPRARRRPGPALIAAVAAGVVAVAVAVALLTGSDDDAGRTGTAAATTPTPSATPSATRPESPKATAPELPAGVECSGAACAGKDADDMGCGGEHVRTVSSVTVGGAFVEVRYSETCSTAWARITKAAPGDTVEITSGPGGGQDSAVKQASAETYTAMVAVERVADIEACATLASGTRGCTAEASP
ncbi:MULTISPECIES: XRE family transcriptional regulator [unclassified Streptomyces]|uniref:helix-turn-helix domain-containing protein n=1 Tax=unclassified Streptomyces TaxID=2593676 RepID=UPI000365271C|nr:MULTISPECIES: XRE family transcriptional regulator [unclassified Streptomyces]MYY04149.1 DUF2690 domain-containing protein [Streptomyces sp. SID4913]